MGSRPVEENTKELELNCEEGGLVGDSCHHVDIMLTAECFSIDFLVRRWQRDALWRAGRARVML